LHRVAKALVEFETLTGEEVKALMRGEEIRRNDTRDTSSGRPRSSIPSSGSAVGTKTPGLEPRPQPGA